MTSRRSRAAGDRGAFCDYRAASCWLDSLLSSGIRPGLTRMRALLRAARNPHRAYETVIVAGTNGKGSTSATIAAILQTAGIRTGLYTSPHLVALHERWRINGLDASKDAVLQAAGELRVASRVSGIVPTYFEALTLLAFLIFHDEGCEVAVLEVGMGGRLDATNVTRPLAALITPIALDHREYLGETIARIAREKAGVIHRGSIALTSSRDPEAVAAIRARAGAVLAPLIEVLEDCSIDRVVERLDGTEIRLTTPHDSYALHTPLRGAFQAGNVTLAVRGAEVLASRFPSITREAITLGVRTARWRGRLERFKIRDRSYWVDGGHNEDAIRTILPYVRRSLTRPRCLVFGIMKDKDFEPVARLLFREFDRVILTRPDPERGCDPRALARIAEELGVPAGVRATPERAITLAIEEGWSEVLICGSLYLAGAAIAMLDRITTRIQ